MAECETAVSVIRMKASTLTHTFKTYRLGLGQKKKNPRFMLPGFEAYYKATVSRQYIVLGKE